MPPVNVAIVYVSADGVVGNGKVGESVRVNLLAEVRFDRSSAPVVLLIRLLEVLPGS